MAVVTESDLGVLMGFLGGGLLLGIVAAWLDSVMAFIKGRG